jgi:uncharacterized membrane protein YeaQ/YmgE (transglycosylase-associated protein family)
MAAATASPYLGLAMMFDVRYAAFFWPMFGLAAGLGATLCFGDGLPLLAANVVVGVCGAGVGGLATLAFTLGEPESGGFWTSFVTSVIGSLVALGLWRAIVEANLRAGADGPARDERGRD